MEFFTNRIIVNESKKSFADIISEVTNKGMKKKASVLKQKDNKSDVIKVASITKISKLGDDEAELDIEVEDTEDEDTEVEDTEDEDTEVEDTVDEDSDDDELEEDDADEDDADEDDADEDDTDDDDADDDDADDDDVDTEVEDTEVDHLELLSNFEKEMGLGKESNESYSSYSDEKSASSVQFVKIANLTDKQKTVFRTYWSNIWPKSFIDAVLDIEN